MPRIARSSIPAAIATVFVLTAARPVFCQGSLAIDQPSSTLVASGTVAGAPIVQQGPGSLTTTYSGSVGVSALDLNAGTLTLDSTTTSLIAANSGSWSPLAGGAVGTAPANYGGRATISIIVSSTTVDLAVRSAVVDFSSSPTVTLTPTGPGTFTFPANQTVTFLTGSVDYRDSAGLVAPGTSDLTGKSGTNSPAGPATFTSLGGNLFSLSYPVDATINATIQAGVTATIRIQGTINAQGTIVPVPEPSLTVSVCFGAFGAMAVLRRKELVQRLKATKSPTPLA
jgi:hypothetical protein